MTTKFELPMSAETARDLLGIARFDDMTYEERTLIEACKLAIGRTWKSKLSIPVEAIGCGYVVLRLVQC